MRDVIKPFLEGLNVAFWVLNETPKIMIDSSIESSEFHALKIKKKKI